MPQGSVLGPLLLLTFLVLVQGSLLSLRFENAVSFQPKPKLKASKNYVPVRKGPTAVIHRLQSVDLPPHCHIAANISHSKLLKDESGNFYLYNQYAKDRFKDDPCAKQKRFKRQSELENRIKQANVEVQSLESNVSISQLINITSGKSTVDIREDFVKININSDQSHIRITPEKSHVNITVKKPFVIVNVSEEDGFEMSTDQSEMFIHTKRVNQEAYIMMQSGKSNMTVRSGLAEVIASNADVSNVTIQTWFADIKPRMVISSNVTRPDGGKGKILGILLLTKMSRTEINLISASVRIKYGKIDLRISEDDHTITIFTGVYTVRIATVTSPYTIVIQDDIDIQIEESSVTLIPETSDVIGVIPTYSEMNIKPDKNTTLQLIMGDQKPNSIADALDTEIDVTSEKLNFTVLPAESRITAQSTDTKALITTNDVQAGIQADRSNIDILAGSPLILVTTRNTTIQIGPDTGNHGNPHGNGNGGDGHNGNGNGNGNNGGEITTPNSGNGGGGGTTSGNSGDGGGTTSGNSGNGGGTTNSGNGGGTTNSGNGGGTTNSGNGGGTTNSGNGGGTTNSGNGGGTTNSGNGGGTTNSGNGGGTTNSGNGGGTTSGNSGNGGGTTSPNSGNGDGTTTTPNSGNGGGTTRESSGNGGGTTSENSGNGGGTTSGNSGNGGATTSSNGATTSTLANGARTTPSLPTLPSRSSTAAGNIDTSPLTQVVSSSTSPVSSSRLISSTFITESTTGATAATATTSTTQGELHTTTVVDTSSTVVTGTLSGLSSTLTATQATLTGVSGSTATVESTISTSGTRVTGSGTTVSEGFTGSAATSTSMTGTGSSSAASPSTATASTAPSISTDQTSTSTSGLSQVTTTGQEVTTSGSATATISSQRTDSTGVSGSTVSTATSSQFTTTSAANQTSTGAVTESSILTTTSGAETGATTGSLPTSDTLTSTQSSELSNTTTAISPESTSADATGSTLSTATASVTSPSSTLSSIISTTGSSTVTGTGSTSTSGGLTIITATMTASTGVTDVDNSGVTIISGIEGIQLPPIGLTVQDTVPTVSPTTTTTIDSLIPFPQPSPFPIPKPTGNDFDLLPFEFFGGGEETANLRRLANPPPDEKYLLSVGVKVKRNMDSSDAEFIEQLASGLRTGYVEARREQLGMEPKKRKRRQIDHSFATTKPPLRNGEVDLRLTSIDRATPELVRVRFFLLSHGDYVEAEKAKSTYDLITTEDLSAMMQHPVVEPVQPLIVSTEPEEKVVMTKFAWALVIFLICLLFIALTLAICYCIKVKKQRKRDQVKSIANYHRPTLSASTAAQANGRRTWDQHSVTETDGPIIESARSDSYAHSESSKFGSPKRLLLGELPPLRTDTRLIQDMSSDQFDLKQILAPSSPPYSTSPNTSQTWQTHKIAPDLPPAAMTAWQPGSEAMQPVIQVRKVSEAQQRHRQNRETARRLLDAAFPLTATDGQRFLSRKVV